MNQDEWTREQLGELALNSLEVHARIGAHRLYLHVCSRCNHPSVNQVDETEQYCPYCGDFTAMSVPAPSPPTGPLLVVP